MPPQYTQKQNDIFKSLFGENIPGYVSEKDSLEKELLRQKVEKGKIGEPSYEELFKEDIYRRAGLGEELARGDSTIAFPKLYPAGVVTPKEPSLAEKKWATLTSAQQDTAILREEGLIPKLPTPQPEEKPRVANAALRKQFLNEAALRLNLTAYLKEGTLTSSEKFRLDRLQKNLIKDYEEGITERTPRKSVPIF